MSETPETSRDSELSRRPNKYAAPHGFEYAEGEARFRGYQEYAFELARQILRPRNESLIAKDAALAQIFTPEWMARRTVLDLGGNNGFFALRALLAGAAGATVVDLDSDCVTAIDRLRARVPDLSLHAEQGNFEAWETPADVVLAFALVHWVYACTSEILSLRRVVSRLAALTRDFALIEWVDPSDPLVESYRHVQIRSGVPAEPYTFDRFLEALKQEFGRVQLVGELSPTRRIFLASRRQVPDLSWDAPLLHPKETLLSSRRLWTVEGVEFWSRVYRVGNRVLKQCTPVLAERELAAIAAVDDPSIASAELAERGERAWVIRLPYWDGQTLDSLAAGRRLGPAEILSLADKLLKIVSRLRSRGVEHRDLHPSNVLVLPGGELRLVDFAWSTVPGGREITPTDLGRHVTQPVSETSVDIRPPEGGGDDLYAVGQIVRWLNRDADPGLSFLALSLAHRDVRLRLSEAARARELVAVLAEGAGDPSSLCARAIAVASETLGAAERSTEALTGRIAQLEAALGETIEATRRNASAAAEWERERQRLAGEQGRLETETKELRALLRARDQELEWMRHTRAWKLRDVWVGLRTRLRAHRS